MTTRKPSTPISCASLGEVHRLGGRVRARAGDDGRPLADGADGDAEELEALVFGQRRRLARRAGDDETVRAVVDEMVRERREAVEVDRAVLAERRDDRRQDFAEHASDRSRALEQCVEPDGDAGRQPAELSSASFTPGANASRDVVSWRIVSVCPGPPRITSWCATRPGSRTE